ncbi:MAG TPA: nucleoside hydrolase [Gammaproteobacteria bacterium]|nr:nucleoside hydrolase [Gammaproteobacteria bacterium]
MQDDNGSKLALENVTTEQFNLELKDVNKTIPHLAEDIIYFCDPGTDDLMCIAQLYAHREMNILMTITGDGNVSLDNVTSNALLMTEITERHDIPVYPGSSGPSQSTKHREDGTHVFGVQGLGALTAKLPNPVLRPGDKNGSGAQHAIDAIKKAKRPITLVSTGGLTDLYRVLSGLNEEDFKNIAAISLMGGVIDQHQCNAPLKALGAPTYVLAPEIAEQKPAEEKVETGVIKLYKENGKIVAMAQHPSGLQERLAISSEEIEENLHDKAALCEKLKKYCKFTRHAEFNIIYDPDASKGVFDIAQKNNIPVLLQPLDLTHTVTYNRERSLSLRNANNNYVSKVTGDLMLDVPPPYLKRFGEDDPQQAAHDLNASNCLAHSDVYKARRGFLRVAGQAEPNPGMTTFVEHPAGNVYQLFIPPERRPEFFKRLEQDFRVYNTPNNIIKGILYDMKDIQQALDEIETVIKQYGFKDELSLAGLKMTPDVLVAVEKLKLLHPELFPELLNLTKERGVFMQQEANKQAELQRKYWDASKGEFKMAPLWEAFLARAPNKAIKILDFGCGYGRIPDELIKRGYPDVQGVDESDKSIARGLAKFPHLEGKLKAIRDFQSGFESQSFDAVFLISVLTSLSDPKELQALMSEVSRVLKPGGILVLSDYRIAEEDYAPQQDRYKAYMAEHGNEGASVIYGMFKASIPVQGGDVVFRHFKRKTLEKLLADNNFNIEVQETGDNLNYGDPSKRSRAIRFVATYQGPQLKASPR